MVPFVIRFSRANLIMSLRPRPILSPPPAPLPGPGSARVTLCGRARPRLASAAGGSHRGQPHTSRIRRECGGRVSSVGLRRTSPRSGSWRAACAVPHGLHGGLVSPVGQAQPLDKSACNQSLTRNSMADPPCAGKSEPGCQRPAPSFNSRLARSPTQPSRSPATG